MANPILPLWEYIPDGEPRVFGDRVYLYGSHDRPGESDFCDYKLKVWSASKKDLNNWQCHGDSFRTRDGARKADVPWTDALLFAPDVVEKDGKYYLYAYIVGSKGAVGVSDKPEGPFKLLSQYKYDENTRVGDDGIFNDAGVLVDDDGKVYVFYGFTESNMNELNPENMYEVISDSYKRSVINDSDTAPEEERFFEASSPRKINGKYYLIYSPKKGSRLAYAISDSPAGPYEYKGYIIDNGDEYPGGNNHGSVCCIDGQWYIFYHRMTNNSIMSRRACVEKIEIMPDGTIPTVEMTSLGFEDSLDPYKITPAEIACVLKGECFISEKDMFTRTITNIKAGCVIGYKYFDFGQDYTGDALNLMLKIRGLGTKCKVKVFVDGYEVKEYKDSEGKVVREGYSMGMPECIGEVEIGLGDGVYKGKMKNITGQHSVYFVSEIDVPDWTKYWFGNKLLFELEEFAFAK